MALTKADLVLTREEIARLVGAPPHNIYGNYPFSGEGDR